MATTEQVNRRRRSSRQQIAPAASTETTLTFQQQLPPIRREEIRRYLELFGYKPESSILQIHEGGSFGRRASPPREAANRAKTAARYGGRTFTVIGRTHDKTFLDKLIPPRRKEPESGYQGYLFKEKDPDEKPPDELLPLDFTPAPLHYPRDWKDALGSQGYLVTMHVPSDFARKKNELIRRLSRIKGDVNVKNDWKFLGELEEFGYAAQSQKEESTDK